ncbi:MAG: TetR/AcrR family transcriptional regulator [Myxococcota bacterium]
MTNRKRGRPSTIDENEVVDKTLKALWRRGFHATSMNDLAREVGVSKPSLYNMVGDKNALLQRALTQYCGKNVGQVEAILKIESPVEFFRAYWQILIDGMCDDQLPDGCFLVQTTIECRDAALKPFIEGLHADTHKMIAARLSEDLAQQRIRADVDLSTLADFVGGQAFALAVMSRAGADRTRLERFADQAAAALGRLCDA